MSYATFAVSFKQLDTPEELECALEELLERRSTSILVKVNGVNVNQSFTFDIEPIISKIRNKYNKYLICLVYDEIDNNLLRGIRLYNRSKDCGCDCDGDCDWDCDCDCAFGGNDDNETDDDTDNETDDDTDNETNDDTNDDTADINDTDDAIIDEFVRELDDMMRPCA